MHYWVCPTPPYTPRAAVVLHREWCSLLQRGFVAMSILKPIADLGHADP
jgi:hypothetical protein